MLNATGFFIVNLLEAQQAIAEREQEGWRIFRLPTGMLSKTDFFEGVRRTLPLDPPLQSNQSWDALADSLWAGLDSFPESKIVIMWPEASAMEKRAPEDFAIATDILAELPDSLRSVDLTAGAPKELMVIRAI